MIKRLLLPILATLILSAGFAAPSSAAVIGVSGAVRPGHVAEDVKAIQDLGAAWVLVTISWADVEPTRGKFDFTKTDAIIRSLAQARISVLATVKCSSPWGTVYPPGGTSLSSAPKSYDEYAKFVKAVVARYGGAGSASGLGGSVRVWQLEDESEGRSGWASNSDSLIRTVQTGANEIRRTDKGATILVGGVASETILYSAIYDKYIKDSVEVSQGRSSVTITRAALAGNRRFLTKYRSARALLTSVRDEVDGVALRLFGRADLIDAEIRWARAKLKGLGYPAGTPIWVTACGGPDAHYSAVSADANAAEVAKRVVSLVSGGVQGVFWAPMLADSEAAAANPDIAAMALVDKTGARRPSFGVYQTLASKLEDATGGERLSAAHGIYFYRLDRKQGALFAAWSRVKVEATLMVPDGMYTITRFNLAAGGKPQVSTATASGGLKVMLNSTPLLVEAR